MVIFVIEKIALAPCNGMSPNGLVSRVAVGDCRKENANVIGRDNIESSNSLTKSTKQPL